MSEKIKIEGTFDGVCSFSDYSVIAKTGSAKIDVVCVDDETGEFAYGSMFCTPKAISYTVKRLKQMGVTGDTDQEVLANAQGELVDKACTFETEERDGYINATNIRGKGEAAGGNASAVKGADFMNAIFGDKTTASKTPVDTPRKAIEDMEDAPY